MPCSLFPTLNHCKLHSNSSANWLGLACFSLLEFGCSLYFLVILRDTDCTESRQTVQVMCIFA